MVTTFTSNTHLGLMIFKLKKKNLFHKEISKNHTSLIYRKYHDFSFEKLFNLTAVIISCSFILLKTTIFEPIPLYIQFGVIMN